MGIIGILAKFPAGLAGAETPKAKPPSPSKPFIPRGIFARAKPMGAIHLETAALMGHIHRDPKNHQ
jgi:hypothetical protein